MLISVGSKAPAFALPCQPGQVVDLATVIGHEKVVLLFFPLAFSPVCTQEMCHFRDAWSKLSAMNCKIFGVSVDSPFVVAKFREMENIPFPLLSDFNKDVARTYGALHEDLMDELAAWGFCPKLAMRRIAMTGGGPPPAQLSSGASTLAQTPSRRMRRHRINMIAQFFQSPKIPPVRRGSR